MGHHPRGECLRSTRRCAVWETSAHSAANSQLLANAIPGTLAQAAKLTLA